MSQVEKSEVVGDVSTPDQKVLAGEESARRHLEDRRIVEQNKEFEMAGANDYKRIKALTDADRAELKRLNNHYDPNDPHRGSGYVRGKSPRSVYGFSGWLKDVIVKERLPEKPVLSEDEEREREAAGREYAHKSVGFARAAFEGGDRGVAIDVLKDADLLKDPKIERWLSDEIVRLATSENPKDFEEARELRNGLPNDLIGKIRNRVGMELKRLNEIVATQSQIERVQNEQEKQRLSDELSKVVGVVSSGMLEVQDAKLQLSTNRGEEGVVGTIWKRLTGGRTRSDVEAELKASEARYEQAKRNEADIRDKIKKIDEGERKSIERQLILNARSQAA